MCVYRKLVIEGGHFIGLLPVLAAGQYLVIYAFNSFITV